jgi:RNA polymerase sigma-70 factor (ECF subfamily)
LVNAVNPTDEDLMLRFQEGDHAAFESLYRRYRAPIFSFLARQRGNRDFAEDLLQEVFARAVRGARDFKHGSRFSTWIYAIARNLAVDEARKARFRVFTSLDQKPSDDSQALGERLAAPTPGPDRSVVAKRLQDDLICAISALPEEQREVFLLREHGGLSFGEISEVVGAKEGTVKSRMRYALEALRSDLARHEEYARTLS